jgi:hypothetical protein
MGDNPILVLDEELFFQALETLLELEGGDDKYELLNVVSTFTAEPYLAARFESEVGREFGNKERRAIDQYVAAIYLISHHNAELSNIREIRGEFGGPALDFIQQAAWAFLTAWTQRYGGVRTRLRVDRSETLIDPTAGDPN